MKLLKPIILCLTLITYISVKAQFLQFNQPYGMIHADITVADIDGDGDLDVIASGETTENGIVKPVSAIYQNTGGLFKQQFSYHNPIFEPDFADPTILKDADGWFYGYATENTWNDGIDHLVPIIKSKDLTNWQFVADAFTTRPTWKTSGGIWAPDVTFVNGSYYMYYACSTWGDSNPGIGLAIADNPTGPFVDQGKVFDTKSIGVTNSIDPNFFQTGSGTTLKSYLFWGSFNGIYGIQLSTDLKSTVGLKFKIAGNAFEAPYIKEKNGKFYFFGSVGSCCDGANSQYHVCMASSTSIRGPYLDKTGTSINTDGVEGSLLIAGNSASGWVGPGHNSKIITDDAGNDFFLYHAISTANPLLPGGATRRPLMMDKLTWTNGWPGIFGSVPSVSPQEVPFITLQSNPNVIIPGNSADIKFGDIDGNGTLDAIFNGNSNDDLGKGIALNDGTGIFTRSALDMTRATVSCGFADFNNDGLLDYYTFGNGTANMGTIFFQNADGTFTRDSSSFTSLNNLTNPNVTILDFNNDGNIDMFVCGWDSTANLPYSAILLNDGYGKFTVMAQPGLIRKGNGSVVWGDVDGDGWLDLLLNGDGGADGEASSTIYRLYKNNGGILEPKATFNDYSQMSLGNGARMVDWDNDGKLDIILTGWSNTKAREVTMLFTCTDPANFTYVESPLSNTAFPGVSQSSIETADLNNDGKIDLLITGFTGNETNQTFKYNRNISGYYLNRTANVNVKPSVVGNLAQAITRSGDETRVSFTWDAATDDLTPQKSLTYNLSLRNTTTGKWMYNPMAVMGGTTDGWRKVSSLGNVYTNRRWELHNLPAGNYEWTVQAIDANFVGGPFAAVNSFTIGATGIVNVISGVDITAENGKLHVQNKTGSILNISVYSTTGSLLKQLNKVDNLATTLNQGVYIVKAVVGHNTMVQKVVI